MTATKQRGGRRAGAGRLAGPPSKVVRLPVPLADLAHELATAKRYGDVASFIDVEGRSALRVPMMAWSAACGFPSPAEDYLDRPLDFNELLIENPAATFAVRIAGESMTGAGLFPGDIAVVDRAREPVDGCDRAGAARRRIHREALSQEGRRGVAASRKSRLPDIRLSEEQASKCGA